jgi:UDPglucose 6-dehydrogenase
MDETRRIYGERDDLALVDHQDEALDGADALAVCTEWKPFRVPDFDVMAGRLNNRLIFDGRNLYDPDALAASGFVYYGIGRGESVRRG